MTRRSVMQTVSELRKSSSVSHHIEGISMNELDADVKRAIIILSGIWWMCIIGLTVFVVWLVMG